MVAYRPEQMDKQRKLGRRSLYIRSTFLREISSIEEVTLSPLIF
jgi:hypothetical protein